jgi:hypothetical protein
MYRYTKSKRISRLVKSAALAFSILFLYSHQAEAQAVAAVKIGGKWGYIDQIGNIAIPFKYDAVAERFYEGLAWVKKGDKYGFINTRGKWAIKPKFDTVIDFHRGRALVKKLDHWFMLDHKGRTVMECISYEPYKVSSIGIYHDGRALVNTDKGYGYINMNGIWMTEPKYQDAKDFSEGMAVVRYKGKVGYIDTTGKFIIEPFYDNGASYSEGKACVVRGGSFWLIDHKGEKVLTLPHLDDVTTISQGVMVIQQQGRWKVLAVATNTSRDLGYSYGIDSFYYVYPFKENIAAWVYTQKWKPGYRCGYIDLNLNVIKPYEFEWVKEFSNGLAAIKTKGRYGYVDKKGTRVIPNIYEEAMDFYPLAEPAAAPQPGQ